MQKLVYHGSPTKFSKFNFSKMGTESGTSGAGVGLYFSESKADARVYGKYLYTCMLELQTNVSNEKVTFQPTMLKSIIDNLESDGADIYSAYGENQPKVINMLIGDSDSDVEIIGDIVNGCFGGNPDHMLETLTKYGLTHTIDHKTPEDETITHYIVYDLDAITIQKVEML